MTIEPQVDSTNEREYNLLTAYEKYIRNEMSIDELRSVQQQHAQSLKAVALRLAEVEQLNQELSPPKNASK